MWCSGLGCLVTASRRESALATYRQRHVRGSKGINVRGWEGGSAGGAVNGADVPRMGRSRRRSGAALMAGRGEGHDARMSRASP